MTAIATLTMNPSRRVDVAVERIERRAHATALYTGHKPGAVCDGCHRRSLFEPMKSAWT
jgi:TPP-dependent indolepyruvate ferredoxin oxidoreductase alpha subunit